MIGKGKSFGAITVVSALASGKGCALGIDLPLEVEIELERGKFERKSFVDFCIEEVFNYFNVSYKPNIRIDSKIPVARGLKSSSALANALIFATLNALGESLDDEEILKINVRASRRSGVSITGALDDASACLFGGLVFTDNKKDEILKRKKFEENLKCVLYIPKEESPTKNLIPKLKYIQKYSNILNSIFSLAFRGEVFEAMTLNGLTYSPILGFSCDKILKAISAGAKASSLSGTGSAVAALISKKCLKDVVSAWEKNVMVVDVRRGCT
ncbi:MAG: shikimate kinase [Candidatus Methanofastidiosia archaeon]